MTLHVSAARVITVQDIDDSFMMICSTNVTS